MLCDDTATNTLKAVTIQPGWWRASPHSDALYRCAYSGACREGLCTEGHKGATCRVCKRGYAYDALENKCTRCADILKTVLAILGGAALLAVAVAVLVRRYPSLFETIAKDVARGTVEQDEDKEEQDEDVSHKWFRSAKSKAKILLGVYQAVRESTRCYSAFRGESMRSLFVGRCDSSNLSCRRGTGSRTRCPESCPACGTRRRVRHGPSG